MEPSRKWSWWKKLNIEQNLENMQILNNRTIVAKAIKRTMSGKHTDLSGKEGRGKSGHETWVVSRIKKKNLRMSSS